MYCASKAHNELHTKSYAREAYHSQNVDFLVYCPHWVSTNSNRSAPGVFVKTAEESLTALLRQLGHTDVSPGHFNHWALEEVVGFFNWLLPVKVFERLYTNVLGKARSIGTRPFMPYDV